MNSVTKYNLERYDNDREFDLYSKWKNHKKRIEIMLRFLDDAFQKSHKDKKDFTIIDIGGNTGVISKLALDKGYNVTVADISEKALSKAKSKGLKTVKLDFNENFCTVSVKYDVVIAGEVIEHVLDVESFLKGCHYLLKEDGYLILSTPNLANFKDRIGFLFGKMPRQINPIHEYLKLHIRHFNYNSLKKTLDFCDFKMLAFKSNYFTLSIHNKAIFIRSLGILFPKMSSSLIVLAKKVN